MANTKACIYCGSSDVPFCKAHVLPDSLGSFQNQPTLRGKVCAKCDSAIGQYEDQFVHSGIAAFMRPRIGLKGRSPFRRKHVGQGPIELKTKDPITGYEILIEPTDDGQPSNQLQQCKALPQVIVDDQKGNQRIIKLFDKEITPQSLRQAIKNTGLTGQLKVMPLGLTKVQEDHIFALLKIEHTEISGEDAVGSILPIRATAAVTCDKRYFQAIAKIAFHYYLVSEECYFNGFEPTLEPIRRFIRYGEGQMESFVRQRRGYLTADTANGWRPKYYGHIFVANVSNKSINIRLKFFIGPDCDPSFYDVVLSSNPFTIHIRPFSFGHNYAYFKPHERKGYDGVMQNLGAANRIIVPKGL